MVASYLRDGHHNEVRGGSGIARPIQIFMIFWRQGLLPRSLSIIDRLPGSPCCWHRRRGNTRSRRALRSAFRSLIVELTIQKVCVAFGITLHLPGAGYEHCPTPHQQ